MESDQKIKMVRGKIEDIIRTSYFGGIVDVFKNYTENEAFFF